MEITKVKTKRGGDACSAMNCTNARYKLHCKKMSFFRFPKNEERCKVWVQNTGRKDLLGKSVKQLSTGGYNLCSNHFELNQFIRPAEKDHLVRNAIPTIFNVSNPSASATEIGGWSRHTQLTYLSATVKMKLKAKLTRIEAHKAEDNLGENEDSPSPDLTLGAEAGSSDVQDLKKELKRVKNKATGCDIISMADEDVTTETKQGVWRAFWELPPQVSHCGDDGNLTDSPPADETEEPTDTVKREPSHGEKDQLRSVSVKTEPKDISDPENTHPVNQSSIHFEPVDNEEMMTVSFVKSEPDLCEESDSWPDDQASSCLTRNRLPSGRGSNSGVKRSLEQERENCGKKTKLDTGVGQSMASTSPYPLCLIKSVGEAHESYHIYRYGSPEPAPSTSTSSENNREKKRCSCAEVYLDNAEDDLSGEATGKDTKQQDVPSTGSCEATSHSQQSYQLMKGKQGKKQTDSLSKGPVESTVRRILPQPSEDQSTDTGGESPRKPIAVKSTIYVNRRKGLQSDLDSPSGLTVGYLVNDDTSLASDSKDVVYELCGCTRQSMYERAEEEAWRMLKLPGKGYDSSMQMKNLGLIRFMNRPLFSFSKNDKLYVYLAEVKFKKLLPLFQHEQNYLRCDAVWKLIAPEVRKPSVIEIMYLENFIYMASGHWARVMITPHGLHLMYQLLHKMKTFRSQLQSLRWYKHAHALFYQQKIAHHCPWTLLVTPPTDCEPTKKPSQASSVPKVMKTLTRVDWDHVTKQQRIQEVKLCDGGAGTAIDTHQLSPLLGSALTSLIKLFHLKSIARPFCSCSLSVSDTHLYQPLTVNHTVFRHITEMSFVDFPAPLHCWKRNNGFFVSYVEFSEKTLLPPRDNAEVENLLNAAVKGTDVCFMLEPEMLFLTRIQVSKGGKKTVNPDRVDAIIERARDSMHEKNVKKGRYKNSATRSNNLGLLINLLYLRKMYIKLAETYAWLKPHASAKFFIKHWPHDCPSEKYSSFSSSRAHADDEGDVLDGTDYSNFTDTPSPPWPADDDDEEEDDKTDEAEADDDETKRAKNDSSKVEEAVCGEDDDDVEMVENVPEEEKEVIDLVESSSEEDGQDSVRLQQTQVKETRVTHSGEQGKAAKLTKGKTTTGSQEMKQTDNPKQQTCYPDSSKDDLHSTDHNLDSAGHDLGSASHDLQDSSQSKETPGSLKVKGIKRERLEGMGSDQVNLDRIKREVMDTDEYFSNMPIAIVTDLQDGRKPGEQAVPVKAAELSSAEKYDADIVQQIKREQGQQNKKQAAIVQKKKPEASAQKKGEVDSEDDDNSDDEEAVSFKLESYQRSCTCSEETPGSLKVKGIKRERLEGMGSDQVNLDHIKQERLEGMGSDQVNLDRIKQERLEGMGSDQVNHDRIKQERLEGMGSDQVNLDRIKQERLEGMGSDQVNHDRIKQERLEGMGSDQVNLDRIKCEATDTEYFSNLPITIVTDLQDGRKPGEQAVPVKAAELSSAKKCDADIVQQKQREMGQQIKKPVPDIVQQLKHKQRKQIKQAAIAQTKKGEVDSEDDDDSDDEEAVSFYLEAYQRSCTCLEDSEKGVLTSHSILQSSINQRNTISILNHINQAVVRDNLVFTFTHNNSIFMNVGQLQDLGYIKQNILITSYMHQCPAHWLRKASGFEVNFLNNNGITMNPARDYLVSVELLSFLSYKRRSVMHCMFRKSNIYLHRIGHICPKPRSIARQVLTNSLYLDKVMQAWAKSWTWQDKLKEVEQRRLAGTQPPVKVKFESNRHKASAMERAFTSTEPRFADLLPKKQKGKGGMKVKSKSTYADSSCALYLRKYKVSDLDTSDATASCRNNKSTFYICSPNVMGGVNIVKRKTVSDDGKAKESGKVKEETQKGEGSKDQEDGDTKDEEKEGESTDDDKEHQTNILEGAMLPKSFKDKNQCLKSGVGFAELDTAVIESWIGNKSESHHLVLTGTLTTGITEDGEPFSFCCMRVKDKLYINWGELCMQMVGMGKIYRLARQLHIFLYNIPTILGLHLSLHYGSCMDTMLKPWLCVNSINAVACLSLIDKASCVMFPKTFALLEEHFQNTDHWNLQFRNFILIPKADFVPM